MKGWVYIASNESMKGIVKIGSTSKDPSNRMRELSNTSVPTPFKCEYSALVENYEKTEKKLHHYFNEYRVQGNREFFSVEIEMVVIRLRDFAKIYFEDSLKISNLKIEEMEISKKNKVNEIKQKVQQEQLKVAENNAHSCMDYLRLMACDYFYCKEKINKVLKKRDPKFELHQLKNIKIEEKYKYSFTEALATIFHDIKPKDRTVYGLTTYESGTLFIAELGGFFKNKYKSGFGVYVHHSGCLFIGSHKKTSGLDGHGLFMDRDKGIFLGKWSNHEKISGVNISGNQTKLQVFESGKLLLESDSNIISFNDTCQYIRDPLKAKL
jgi:hypothetical protein